MGTKDTGVWGETVVCACGGQNMIKTMFQSINYNDTQYRLKVLQDLNLTTPYSHYCFATEKALIIL